MISWIISYACFPALCFAILCSIIRFWRGPSTADRVVSWDLFTATILCLLLVFSALTGKEYFTDIFLALSALSFLSTVAYARAIDNEKEGA